MFFLRTLCTTVVCFLMSSTSFICIRALVSLLDAEIIQKTASQKSDWKHLLLLNLAKQWPLFSSCCLFQDNLCFPRPPCYCSSWNVTAAFQNWATSSKFYSKHLRDRQSNIASNLNFLPTVKFTVLVEIGTSLYSCRLSGKVSMMFHINLGSGEMTRHKIKITGRKTDFSSGFEDITTL